MQSGYERLSLRSVNVAAGMNPAAVHYHFGSKDALIAALLEDRLGPLWQERLTELGPGTPVADLVDVVLEPLTELATDPLGRLRLHLLARFVLGRHTSAFTAQWFTLDPWVRLLRAARPDLTEPEAKRRWAMAFTLILQHYGDPLSDAPAHELATPGTLRAFVTAGLNA